MKRLDNKPDLGAAPTKFKALRVGDVFSMEDPMKKKYTEVYLRLKDVLGPPPPPIRRSRARNAPPPDPEAAEPKREPVKLLNCVLLSDDDNLGGQTTVMPDDTEVWYLPDASIQTGKSKNQLRLVGDMEDDDSDEEEEDDEDDSDDDEDE